MELSSNQQDGKDTTILYTIFTYFLCHFGNNVLVVCTEGYFAWGRLWSEYVVCSAGYVVLGM